MDKGQEISVRERLHRSPVGARLALWFVISACGLVIVLQLMFAVIEVARPFIEPITDDSLKERSLVAGTYAIWLGLSVLVSVIAWRQLLRR